MLLTLVAAQFTGEGAGLESGARHGGLEGGLAREDSSGCQAEVGAVQAEADAANHVRYILLGKIGVNVGSAGLLAIDARLNAFRECVHMYMRLAGVGWDQRRGVGHMTLPESILRACDICLWALAYSASRKRASVKFQVLGWLPLSLIAEPT